MNKTKITITLKDREDGKKFDIELTAPARIIAARASAGDGPSLEDLIGDIFDADVISAMRDLLSKTAA